MPRKKPPPPRGPQLEIAGALGVAFVNTAGAHRRNRQQGIGSYADLVTWGQQIGALSALDAERLSRRAAERPRQAEAVFARAVELRGALARLFAARVAEEDLPRDALDLVNAALGDWMSALRLTPGDDGLAWGWGGDEDALDRMLWGAVHSAGEVLIAAGTELDVRRCAYRGCAHFFIDRRQGQRRKFCSKTCGNRAKALRYYYRYARDKRTEENRGLWIVKRPRKRREPPTP